MPLIESVLKAGLKSKIESKLRAEFKKESTKQSLRKKIDQGGLGGAKTNATSWAEALRNVKLKTQPILGNTPDIIGAPLASEQLTLRVTANEFANAVSDSVCEWMSETIAPILADELSEIIASEVTKYIKQATIIVPPGQVVATAGSPAAQTGATTAPSPPAQIT